MLVTFASVTEPSAILAVVTALSASLGVVTAPSARMSVVAAPDASFAVVTAPIAMRGFGYVPVRSPPAGPFGGKELGAPVTLLQLTSVILLSDTEPLASMELTTPPGAM